MIQVLMMNDPSAHPFDITLKNEMSLESAYGAAKDRNGGANNGKMIRL